jgi:hypothetical protein
MILDNVKKVLDDADAMVDQLSFYMSRAHIYSEYMDLLSSRRRLLGLREGLVGQMIVEASNEISPVIEPKPVQPSPAWGDIPKCKPE